MQRVCHLRAATEGTSRTSSEPEACPGVQPSRIRPELDQVSAGCNTRSPRAQAMAGAPRGGTFCFESHGITQPADKAVPIRMLPSAVRGLSRSRVRTTPFPGRPRNPSRASRSMSSGSGPRLRSRQRSDDPPRLLPPVSVRAGHLFGQPPSQVRVTRAEQPTSRPGQRVVPSSSLAACRVCRNHRANSTLATSRSRVEVTRRCTRQKSATAMCAKMPCSSAPAGLDPAATGHRREFRPGGRRAARCR